MFLRMVFMKQIIPSADGDRGKSCWSLTDAQIQPNNCIPRGSEGWIWTLVGLQYDFPRSLLASGIVIFIKIILKNIFSRFFLNRIALTATRTLLEHQEVLKNHENSRIPTKAPKALKAGFWTLVELQYDFPRPLRASGIVIFMKTFLKNIFSRFPIEQNRSNGHQRRARPVGVEKTIQIPDLDLRQHFHHMR